VLIGTEITAAFGDDGKLTGSAGCNSYFGSYEVDGEAITFGPLGSTLMACAEPEGIMNQEQAYLAALESAGTYRIEGDKLELIDADGMRVVQFVVLPPASLAGTQWILTAYNNGQEAVVSVLIGTEITAAFGDNGRLAGSAGCNTYGASYEVDGDDITIGPSVTTRMFCAEPEGIMDQESAFLAALESAATYRIQGDKLEMRTADGALALQFTAVSEAMLTEVAAGEAYIVQPGDWLTKIARNFYGDAGAYRLIVDATNAKAAEDESFAVIDDPNLIQVGQKLWIPSQPGSLTLAALQNTSYQGIYDEPVQLTDGQYEGEPFVPGGASRPTVVLHPEVYAFGDLNGDGVDDAVVILIESSGGSGSFIYLAAVINESGTPVNVVTYFVGDREQVQAITIEDGEITLNMVTHGPDDPMCCPTQEVTKKYQLEGDQLVEL
jgi:heat shock protein HslJ